MSRLRISLVQIGPRYSYVTPPLGILYVAGFIREKMDVDLEVIDQKLLNLANDRLIQRIVDFNPQIIGLSALTPSAKHLKYIVTQIKKQLPNTIVVLGGPHVSSFQQQVLTDTSADAAVPAEGEKAFHLICQAYQNQQDFSQIPGIFWNAGKGDIIKNPGHVPVLGDIDEMPFPAYDLIDLSAYWRFQSPTQVPNRRYITLFSSRGCPYGCSFCHRIFGKRFRAHSAERIVEEIKYYKTKYHIAEVEFVDDIFNLNKKRVFEFSELIRRNQIKIDISFPNALRTDVLDEDVIDALVQAGTYYSGFSLESGSERMQKIIGKHLDIQKFLINVKKAVKKGIYAHGYAMLGFPAETRQDMEDTIRVACQSWLHSISVFTVNPFPNTKLYDVSRELYPDKMFGLTYTDMDYIHLPLNLSMVEDHPFFATKKRFIRKFYLNPGRIMRIIKDYPKPWTLPKYIPLLFERILYH